MDCSGLLHLQLAREPHAAWISRSVKIRLCPGGSSHVGIAACRVVPWGSASWLSAGGPAQVDTDSASMHSRSRMGLTDRLVQHAASEQSRLEQLAVGVGGGGRLWLQELGSMTLLHGAEGYCTHISWHSPSAALASSRVTAWPPCKHHHAHTQAVHTPHPRPASD